MRERAVVVGAVLFFAALALALSGSQLDDAWIFSRYARSLVEHGDVLWNAGEPRVEGFTSWAWLFLHVGALKLGLHPLLVARTAGVLCGAALVAWTAREIFHAAPFGPALLAIALLVLAPDLAYYAASGMDLLLWALLSWAWLLWFARGERLLAAHAVAAALLVLVRPEAMLLLCLCGGRAILDAYSGRTRGAAMALGAGLGVFLALHAARYAAFGKLFANSVYAKHLGGSSLGRALDGVFYLADKGGLYLVPAAVILAVALARSDRALPDRHGRLWNALLAFSALSLGMIVLAGGEDRSAFPFARLVVPCLAPLAYCVAVALAPLQRAQAALALVGLAVTLGYLPRTRDMLKTSAGLTNLSADLSGWRDRAAPSRKTPLSDYLLAHTPPGDLVALPWAGRIPYETGLPTLDLLGLNDPHIASLPPPQRGIDVKYDASYVLARRPYFLCEAISLRAATSELARMTDADLYAAGAWKVGQRALLRDPRFAAGYELDPAAPVHGWGTCYRRKE